MTMEEEFQEADVLWQELPQEHHDRDDDHHGRRHHHHQQRTGSSWRQRQVVVDGAGRAAGTSAPVGIPGGRFPSDDDGAPPESSAEFVPPHEIMAARRRCSEQKAASSVCVGHGRTLKGRDLRSVRTAVLRMTGFLEC